MEVEFSFEDDGSAGIWKLTCACGRIMQEQHERMVNDGDIVECPECHRKYKFIWKGMIVKETK